MLDSTGRVSHPPAARRRLPRRARARLASFTAALALALLAIGCGGGVEERLAEARALQQAGDFHRSIGPLRDALARDPDHADANFLLGLALERTRQPTLAIWPLRKARATEAYAVRAGVLLANTLLSTGGFDEALAAADRVLEVEPGSLAAMLIRAQAHMQTAAHEEALADVEAALDVAPDHEQARAMRGLALAKLGRLDEAEESLRALEARLRERGEPGFALRGCLAVAGFFAEHRKEAAEPEIRRCLEEDPASEEALAVARSYFDDAEREDVANGFYRAAIEEAPDRLALRIALADRLDGQGRAEEAEGVLREAAELFDEASAWDRLARFHTERGDLEQALEANERSLAAPGSQPTLLLFRKADLLVMAGEYDEALAAVEGLEPKYRDAIAGRVRFARGDAAGALEALEASLLRWPNNPGVRYLAGQAAEQAGDVQRARSHYREAVRSGEAATDAALALAVLELGHANWEAAGNAALRQIEHRPFLGPEAHVVAVRAAMAQGRYEAGHRLLDELEEKPGMKGRVVVERAALENRAEGPDAAVGVLRESGLDLTDPEQEVALRLACDYLVAAGRAEEALALVRRAGARSPDAAHPLEIEALVLASTGRRGEAVGAIERWLAADPESARAHVARASLALAEGRALEALRSADAALEADPESSDARYLRAEVLFRQGRSEEAMAELRAVAKRDPSHAAAANDLAWRLAERGEDPERALALARRAVRLELRAETLDTLGWVQLRSGDAAGAAESLARSIEMRADPSVLYRLGLALDELGHSAEALRAFERAVESGAFPEAAEARAQIARLSSAAGALP